MVRGIVDKGSNSLRVGQRRSFASFAITKVIGSNAALYGKSNCNWFIFSLLSVGSLSMNTLLRKRHLINSGDHHNMSFQHHSKHLIHFILVFFLK